VRFYSDTDDIEGLAKLLNQKLDFSLVKLTPTHLDVLCNTLETASLSEQTRSYIVGGEQLNAKTIQLWRDHAPSTRIINEYGPTETVVGCCVYEVNDTTPTEGAIPIGSPIWNTQLYILDPTLTPVPDGISGELYIGGAGLARGYLGRPGLTSERFIACPFGDDGSRMYRTGDLARRRHDGEIEYLGRIDDQVKVRGFRIELGEIEACLLSSFDTLSQAAVLVKEVHGDKRIIAYIVPHAGMDAPDTGELRSRLGVMLPEYMVPGAFVVLDGLPLTPNGKLDRRALPDAEFTGDVYVAPRTAQEAVRCAVYAAVPGVERVGIHDSFFSIGGHSLLAMKVIARLRDETGCSLPLRALFDTPTPEGLGPQLLALEADVGPVLIAGPGDLGDGRVVLSYGQQRLWALDRLEGASDAYNMPLALRLRGGLDIDALRSALCLILERHTVLRTVIVEGEDGLPEGRVLPVPDAGRCFLFWISLVRRISIPVFRH